MLLNYDHHAQRAGGENQNGSYNNDCSLEDYFNNKDRDANSYKTNKKSVDLSIPWLARSFYTDNRFLEDAASRHESIDMGNMGNGNTGMIMAQQKNSEAQYQANNYEQRLQGITTNAYSSNNKRPKSSGDFPNRRRILKGKGKRGKGNSANTDRNQHNQQRRPKSSGAYGSSINYNNEYGYNNNYGNYGNDTSCSLESDDQRPKFNLPLKGNSSGKKGMNMAPQNKQKGHGNSMQKFDVDQSMMSGATGNYTGSTKNLRMENQWPTVGGGKVPKKGKVPQSANSATKTALAKQLVSRLYVAPEMGLLSLLDSSKLRRDASGSPGRNSSRSPDHHSPDNHGRNFQSPGSNWSDPGDELLQNSPVGRRRTSISTGIVNVPSGVSGVNSSPNNDHINNRSSSPPRLMKRHTIRLNIKPEKKNLSVSHHQYEIFSPSSSMKDVREVSIKGNAKMEPHSPGAENVTTASPNIATSSPKSERGVNTDFNVDVIGNYNQCNSSNGVSIAATKNVMIGANSNRGPSGSPRFGASSTEKIIGNNNSPSSSPTSSRTRTLSTSKKTKLNIKPDKSYWHGEKNGIFGMPNLLGGLCSSPMGSPETGSVFVGNYYDPNHMNNMMDDDHVAHGQAMSQAMTNHCNQYGHSSLHPQGSNPNNFAGNGYNTMTSDPLHTPMFGGASISPVNPNGPPAAHHTAHHHSTNNTMYSNSARSVASLHSEGNMSCFSFNNGAVKWNRMINNQCKRPIYKKRFVNPDVDMDYYQVSQVDVRPGMQQGVGTLGMNQMNNTNSTCTNRPSIITNTVSTVDYNSGNVVFDRHIRNLNGPSVLGGQQQQQQRYGQSHHGGFQNQSWQQQQQQHHNGIMSPDRGNMMNSPQNYPSHPQPYNNGLNRNFGGDGHDITGYHGNFNNNRLGMNESPMFGRPNQDSFSNNNGPSVNGIFGAYGPQNASHNQMTVQNNQGNYGQVVPSANTAIGNDAFTKNDNDSSSPTKIVITLSKDKPIDSDPDPYGLKNLKKKKLSSKQFSSTQSERSRSRNRSCRSLHSCQGSVSVSPRNRKSTVKTLSHDDHQGDHHRDHRDHSTSNTNIFGINKQASTGNTTSGSRSKNNTKSKSAQSARSIAALEDSAVHGGDVNANVNTIQKLSENNISNIMMSKNDYASDSLSPLAKYQRDQANPQINQPKSTPRDVYTNALDYHNNNNHTQTQSQQSQKPPHKPHNEVVRKNSKLAIAMEKGHSNARSLERDLEQMQKVSISGSPPGEDFRENSSSSKRHAGNWTSSSPNGPNVGQAKMERKLSDPKSLSLPRHATPREIKQKNIELLDKIQKLMLIVQYQANELDQYTGEGQDFMASAGHNDDHGALSQNPGNYVTIIRL